MQDTIYRFSVQIYYEDTDHSGVVYHANYLKYFERAREDVIGPDFLVEMWKQDGLGFAVYKANIEYHEGAQFGDKLEIRTKLNIQTDYRAIWNHEAWRQDGTKPAVKAEVHLICINKNKTLQPIPAKLRDYFNCK